MQPVRSAIAITSMCTYTCICIHSIINSCQYAGRGLGLEMHDLFHQLAAISDTEFRTMDQRKRYVLYVTDQHSKEETEEGIYLYRLLHADLNTQAASAAPHFQNSTQLVHHTAEQQIMYPDTITVSSTDWPSCSERVRKSRL